MCLHVYFFFFLFFFNDTATTEIYTLSLHDALPISMSQRRLFAGISPPSEGEDAAGFRKDSIHLTTHGARLDRKSTRLNSSHSQISYAVFCLKKKKKKKKHYT